MAKERTGNKPGEVLRARGKKFLAKPGPELDKIPLSGIQKLVHELQEHQVELDMQNDEPRRSHAETEAALARYADLYDSAPIGYFTFNPRGVILEANLTGVRVLGLERGSLLRTLFFLYIVPEFQAEFRAHLQRVFTTQTRQFCTLQLVTSEGAARYVTLESVAVPTNGKGLTQCHSAVSDCTARQLAETDLRHSEEKFHLLFDQAPLGYQSLDEAGRIIEVNQTWLDLMGYSREEVLGRGFRDFLLPGAQALFQKGFTRLKADGEVSGAEWEMVRQDGTTIVTSFNGRAIRDEQGQFLRTHCLFEDITARRQAEIELKKSLSLLHSPLESTADGILVVSREGSLALDEAYPLIAQYVQAIFPLTSGALFIPCPTSTLVEAVATWGDSRAGESIFPPSDCWALRRGRVNIGGNPCRELLCRHLPAAHSEPYMCLPLLAQGETLWDAACFRSHRFNRGAG